MSDYWMGVLSAPALVLSIAAAWAAVKALGWLGDRLLARGVIRLTSQTPEARRAATAAVVYGTRRAWMFAPGETAFIFAVGLDTDEVAKASTRLQPTVSLRQVTKTAAPHVEERQGR